MISDIAELIVGHIPRDHYVKYGVVLQSTTVGKSYTVIWNCKGTWQCTCPDYLYRKRSVNGKCKHIRAVAAFLDDNKSLALT